MKRKEHTHIKKKVAVMAWTIITLKRRVHTFKREKCLYGDNYEDDIKAKKIGW